MYFPEVFLEKYTKELKTNELLKLSKNIFYIQNPSGVHPGPLPTSIT
jgi:hypothetical protein